MLQSDKMAARQKFAKQAELVDPRFKILFESSMNMIDIAPLEFVRAVQECMQARLKFVSIGEYVNRDACTQIKRIIDVLKPLHEDNIQLPRNDELYFNGTFLKVPLNRSFLANFGFTLRVLRECFSHIFPRRNDHPSKIHFNTSVLINILKLIALYSVPVIEGNKQNLIQRWKAVHKIRQKAPFAGPINLCLLEGSYPQNVFKVIFAHLNIQDHEALAGKVEDLIVDINTRVRTHNDTHNDPTERIRIFLMQDTAEVRDIISRVLRSRLEWDVGNARSVYANEQYLDEDKIEQVCYMLQNLHLGIVRPPFDTAVQFEQMKEMNILPESCSLRFAVNARFLLNDVFPSSEKKKNDNVKKYAHAKS